MPDARPGEDALVARYLAPLATHPGAAGLTDDVATLSTGAGETLVLTHDTLVAGVHFFARDAAEDIALKALRVNLSDLAAKTARPIGYLMSLALPDRWTEAWLARFAGGLGREQARHRFSLLGGDTVRARGPLQIGITMIGALPPGVDPPRRGGARPGDAVCVTGTIGSAAIGLGLRRKADIERLRLGRLSAEGRRVALDRYLRPNPPLGALDAVRHLVTASMDVSDGLVGDLARLAAASGAGAAIVADRVPIDPAFGALVLADEALLRIALTGGDDYETLFTCRPEAIAAIGAAAARVGVGVSAIGRIVEGAGVEVTRMGAPMDGLGAGAFRHF